MAALVGTRLARGLAPSAVRLGAAWTGAGRREAGGGRGTAARAYVKVYTRTGDGGASSLFTGERRPKTDAAFAALGAVDEANAFVGAAAEEVALALEAEAAAGAAAAEAEAAGGGRAALLARLRQVQSLLLDTGAALATPASSSTAAHAARAAFPAEAAEGLEAWIDEMDAALPPLSSFILPGGGRGAAALHVARTAARRAERAAVALAADCPAPAAVFLNRLSDFLFVAARYSCLLDRRPEVVYRRPRPPRAPRP